MDGVQGTGHWVGGPARITTLATKGTRLGPAVRDGSRRPSADTARPESRLPNTPPGEPPLDAPPPAPVHWGAPTLRGIPATPARILLRGERQEEGRGPDPRNETAWARATWSWGSLQVRAGWLGAESHGAGRGAGCGVLRGLVRRALSAGHLGARVAHRSGSQGCGASGPRGGVRVATVPRIAPGSGACVGMLHPAGVPSGTPFPAAPGFDFAASRSSPRAALIPGASATLQEVQPQARGTPGPGSVGRGLKPREGSSARLMVDGTARPGLHLGILRCH